MTRLVSAKGVSKHFGDLRAVDNVSFEIEKGRILGLIGPNGAGKTTLLKSVLGLTDCDGQLSVLGLDPFKQRKEMMQNICFIADVAVLPRWIKVTQLLDFVENMGFMMDNLNLQKLSAEQRKEALAELPVFEEGLVWAEVHAAGPAPFYACAGDSPVLVFLVLVIAASWLAGRSPRSEEGLPFH